jgi:NAD(P)-dependent dehydrogenase (short-subunit alcohol dehydrogenase family)
MTGTAKFRLDGKVAIVTGSGRNIGQAVAESFAACGAKVAVNGHRDRAAIDAVVAGIKARGGEAIAVMADVSRDEEVARLVTGTVEAFGTVDIVVSNVGIRRYRAFLDIAPEEWRETIETNLSASFYLARHAIPHMRKSGKGRFILISGFDGFWGQITHRAPNLAAKAGMHGLAKAIAREFGPDGITANTVAPGAIDTVRDWSQYVHQPKEKVEAAIPLGRFGHVDEIAATCVYLASDAGGFVSGHAIHVNGGHYMY